MNLQRYLAITAVLTGCGSGRDVPPGTPGMQNPGRDGGTNNNTPSCPATFEQAPACGGDPIGEWRYATFCADLVIAAAQAQCPNGTFAVSNVTTNGTLSLTSNAFTKSLTYGYTVNAMMPVECLVPLGGCENYEMLIDGSGTSSADCTENGANCNCTLNIVETETSAGLLMVESSTLTFTSTDSVQHLQFCRNGNKMVLSFARTGAPEVFILDRN